ncbi:PREDICTED: uncharacterized protein LOC106891340 [Calidris pugnax]|uniref:uncharacterized protein LOC106891340 n=1 Tax=Calidris pugnax TaxID=198806 RepID=UPI00071CA1D0|nr:PREDICTED: uncharacterized protein LOC106891340 [Calidris pugnax]
MGAQRGIIKGVLSPGGQRPVLQVGSRACASRPGSAPPHPAAQVPAHTQSQRLLLRAAEAPPAHEVPDPRESCGGRRPRNGFTLCCRTQIYKVFKEKKSAEGLGRKWRPVRNRSCTAREESRVQGTGPRPGRVLDRVGPAGLPRVRREAAGPRQECQLPLFLRGRPFFCCDSTVQMERIWGALRVQAALTKREEQQQHQGCSGSAGSLSVILVTAQPGPAP